jgi:predicted transposase YdaD
MTIAEQLLQEGLVKGRVEGRVEGLVKGRVEGRVEGLVEQGRESVIEVLSARFGELPEGLREAISVISDPQKLRNLTRTSATCTSIEDFAGAL